MPVNAADWTIENAIYSVPNFESRAKRASVSSHGVTSTSLSNIPQAELPKFIFLDIDLDEQLKNCADTELAKRFLEPQSKSPQELHFVYGNLFSPHAYIYYGVHRDEWKLRHEGNCVAVVERNHAFAAKFYLNWIFGKKIRIETEPSNTGTDTRERVDLIFFDGRGSTLLLAEGRTPAVMEKFITLLASSETHDVSMRVRASTGENVLFKAMYYSWLYSHDWIIVFDGTQIIVMRKHIVPFSSEVAYAYSKTIEQGDGSDLFRVLLGILLIQLGVGGPIIDPDVDTYYKKYLLQDQEKKKKLTPRQAGKEKKEKKRDGDNDDSGSWGRGPGGGSGAGPSSGPAPGRSASSGTGKSGGKFGFGSLSRLGERSGGTQRGHPYLQTTRLANAAVLSKQKLQEAGLTSAKIIIRGCTNYEGALSESAVFEIVPGVTFPPFGTSETPTLQVEGTSSRGATGLVWKAKLLNPDNPPGGEKYFAVKLVDSASRSIFGYRNSVMDVYLEYVNYCILQLGKRYHSKKPDLRSIIESCTATCFGLYRLKEDSSDTSSLRQRFALITEYAGRTINEFATLNDSVKCAILYRLICLHALGFYHNDPDERNIVKNRSTYKFIDLCNGQWHEGSMCSGFCTELSVAWFTFKGYKDLDEQGDFVEKVLDENGFETPFNLRESLEKDGLFNILEIAPEVKKLADQIDPFC